MRILFTGASSFTGMWFVRALAEAGHHVTFTTRRPVQAYEDLRRRRLENLLEIAAPLCNCAFGDDAFLRAIDGQDRWDLLCHHAADVTDYKSADFDVARALGQNTLNLRRVLERLRDRSCQHVLLTGSVFERGEGAGSDDLRAFSPYGLSKGLTAEMFSHYARDLDIHMGKFVIPNPFGPFEEPRFTSYLVRTWMQEKCAAVNTPEYVRDNIHVSLLAPVYVRFAEALHAGQACLKLNPSGYVESQGAFTRRFADAMRPRLGLACAFELKAQEQFPEPRIRINTDPVDVHALDWDEERAWDDLASYYRTTMQQAVGA